MEGDAVPQESRNVRERESPFPFDFIFVFFDSHSRRFGKMWLRVILQGRCEARTRIAGLFFQQRCFQVIQRGHDRQQESLYEKLGFGRDNASEQTHRSTTDLKQGLVRQVEKLPDPENNSKDAARLAELREAYTQLHCDKFRAQYDSHYYASNDAQLHILCDGGSVAANFNPEHQRFNFVHHHGRAESLHAPAGNPALSARQEAEVPSLDGFHAAFRGATGLDSGAASSATARPYSAAAAHGPLAGADVAHLLRLSFEQGAVGGEVEISYHKHTSCQRCSGTGRQSLRKSRRCPQCQGRGSTHLPSATYHIERRCLYCGGEGTMAPPPCVSCNGRGVQLEQLTHAMVIVPPGTTSHAQFRLRRRGHDGVRGGPAGDVVVSVLVSEHRYFYRSGHELHAMLPLPLSTALLGGLVEVPTLSGRAMLRVPPCVGNGQILPLHASGAPEAAPPSPSAPGAPTRLLFHALVIIPRSDGLSGRQRSALSLFGKDSRETAMSSHTETEEFASGGMEELSGVASESRISTREDLMAECAVLKKSYRHWLSHL